MVFCRGCSKEIHESAQSCPHCGATQAIVAPSSSGPGWMSIVSAILAGLAFIGSLDPDVAYDKDATLGIGMFGVISVVLGAISLQQKKMGKTLPIIAITFAVLGLLILIGNTN